MAESYRVAVVGSTGRGGYGHALDEAFIDVPNTQIVAVADDDEKGRAQTATKLSVQQAFADYRKMLDAAKPDILVIAPSWIDRRRDMAVAAAERGIHMYVEKPFCRSLAEADEIVDACQRTHTKLAIAHPTRYSPKLDRIKRLIEAGRFGKVLEYRGRGKEDRRGGGQDLWVLGTHVMDMIRTLAGHPQWCFASVEQDGQPVRREHVVEGGDGIGPLAGDLVRAMYRMPDGTTAYFSSVRNVAGNPTRYGLRIYCSHGLIELLEGTMGSVKCLRDRGWSPARSGNAWLDVSSQGWDKPETLTDAKYASRHRLAIDDLLSAIENNREPKGGMHEARGAVEMIAAVFESHRVGGPVTLPLKNRQNPLTMLKA
ncbi:MAG: Gfo/Idh/MocA family oxidoreductase [Planctomycetota bacterium]|nr:Gfo/Idh/MocA family oxidoreductase [Planctomycetota bacterium]